MPKEFSRTRRIAEQVQRELADLLSREVSDPRLHGVTLSGVEVTKDLSQAKVYVTLPAGADIDNTLKALTHAGGFLRHGLAQRVQLRCVPKLLFLYDQTLDNANRVEALLDRALHGSDVEVPNGETT